MQMRGDALHAKHMAHAEQTHKQQQACYLRGALMHQLHPRT